MISLLKYDNVIVAETFLPVHHYLLGTPDAELSDGEACLCTSAGADAEQRLLKPARLAAAKHGK